MAETVSETNASSLLANETTSNATATANVTGRAAATPEGLATAYCSLVVLAIIPIVIGSIRSIAYQKAAKKKAQASRRTARTKLKPSLFSGRRRGCGENDDERRGYVSRHCERCSPITLSLFHGTTI